MRVLLCHQPTDGGVARHVRDLADGMSARGIEVVLASPAPPEGLRAPLRHVRVDLQRAVAPRADLAALARLTRLIRQFEPDVIHAHSSKAGALTRLARVSAPRIPVLYTPHGYAFAGHFSRPGERLAYRLVERALSPLATQVVCVCEAEARLARSVGAADRVRVIHNGIPAAQGALHPAIEQLRRSGPVIGALTLLRPGKGLETLISALPAVLAAHPDAQVAIVGEGPDLEALRASAGALGVAGALHFLGPSSDPVGALRSMDVFVHPSWAESFPYVILEAMSAGRAIVASDVGGIGEAVIDGESGLLVPPRDAPALANALIGILADPARSRLLGSAALERARRSFPLEGMVDATVALYEACARPVHGAPG